MIIYVNKIHTYQSDNLYLKQLQREKKSLRYVFMIRSKIEDEVHKNRPKYILGGILNFHFEFCGQLLNYLDWLRGILNIRTEAIISSHIGKVFPYDKCTNSIITVLQNQCLRWS